MSLFVRGSIRQGHERFSDESRGQGRQLIYTCRICEKLLSFKIMDLKSEINLIYIFPFTKLVFAS